MSDLTENQRRFLVGLARLTRETGVAIWCDASRGFPLIDAEQSDNPEAGYVLDPGGDIDWTWPGDYTYPEGKEDDGWDRGILIRADDAEGAK